MRRRQEDQDRVNQQNEFMRASLRESKKLQALQANRLPDRPAGFENTAYAEDEDLENTRGRLNTTKYKINFKTLILILRFSNTHLRGAVDRSAPAPPRAQQTRHDRAGQSSGLVQAAVGHRQFRTGPDHPGGGVAAPEIADPAAGLHECADVDQRRKCFYSNII